MQKNYTIAYQIVIENLAVFFLNVNLISFSHRHLVPIIASLQYNTWFTSLNANNIKLVSDLPFSPTFCY